jgi:hypothetical protein
LNEGHGDESSGMTAKIEVIVRSKRWNSGSKYNAKNGAARYVDVKIALAGRNLLFFRQVLIK